MSTLKGRNLISITDFSKEEYIEVLDIAEGFEKNPKQRILEVGTSLGNIAAEFVCASTIDVCFHILAVGFDSVGEILDGTS